jgi:hypothetical protein
MQSKMLLLLLLPLLVLVFEVATGFTPTSTTFSSIARPRRRSCCLVSNARQLPSIDLAHEVGRINGLLTSHVDVTKEGFKCQGVTLARIEANQDELRKELKELVGKVEAKMDANQKDNQKELKELAIKLNWVYPWLAVIISGGIFSKDILSVLPLFKE